jgi:drug/metabolite transporter (DMT)-like permease
LTTFNLKQHAGAFWISLSIVFASSGNAFVHHLVQRYSPIQLLFIKSCISFLVLLFIQSVRSPQTLFDTAQRKYQIIRGCVGFIGVYAWIEALRSMPLSDASALSMSSSLFTALGGYFIFKEKISWRKNTALIFGAIGVFVILNPHFSNVPSASFALLSAIAFATSALLAKTIMNKDDALTTTLYLTGVMTMLSLLWGLTDHTYHFQVPQNSDVLFMSLIGIFYVSAQLCFVKAYQVSEVTYLAPLKFLKFPLNTLWGFIFFFEVPTTRTALGTVMIIVANSLLFGRK